MDDVLGGFEEEDPDFEVDLEGGGVESRPWDLSGSVETSGSVNFLRHESAAGTDYTGLSRLRNRLNLQLDVELAEGWRARAEGWAFADSAYLLNGRDDYTSQVLREYELDAEVGELWLQAELAEWLDVKAGRQVVIWGRSESLRVLDVLNPLDNREPGRVDLEDLRRPVSMLKLDAYWGDWSITAIAIPEVRFDLTPVFGSDFSDLVPPPGFSLPRELLPRDFEDPEFAAAVTGIFSGWDISFHGAWFWNDTPRFDRILDRTGVGLPSRSVLVHDRLWMLGTGGNLTRGSWLLKSELAYLEGFDFAATHDGGASFFPVDDRGRIDVLAGLEYYGVTNTTFSVEIAVQHWLRYERELRRAPNFVRETSEQVALRLTRNFLRERLTVTLLAILFEIDARDGALLRADADYELLDAVSVGLGVILYESGARPPFDAWQRNDRVIFNVKWSF